jgi:hypothetical protein
MKIATRKYISSGKTSGLIFAAVSDDFLLCSLSPLIEIGD